MIDVEQGFQLVLEEVDFRCLKELELAQAEIDCDANSLRGTSRRSEICERTS